MASIEFIKRRIDSSRTRVEKLEKKLERIYRAKEHDWVDAFNPYGYYEYDLRKTERELSEAREALHKYTELLVKEAEKAASRNVPAIVEFIDGWKKRMTEFYAGGLADYYRDSDEVKRLILEASEAPYLSPEYKTLSAKAEAARKKFGNDCHGVYEEREIPGEKRAWRKKKVKVADGKYEHLWPYSGECNFDAAMAKLAKDLNEEGNRKYDFIIERTNMIVGTITDAAALYVGEKGDLNGFIIGTNGKAHVQTIGAGGYNIQCFHYRTLINRA